MTDYKINQEDLKDSKRMTKKKKKNRKRAIESQAQYS